MMLVRMILVNEWRRRRETMTWIFWWKGAKREVGLYTKENRPLTRMLKIAKMKMRTFVLPACREGQRWRWRGRGGGEGRGWRRWRSSKPAPSFSSSTSTWYHDVQMCHTLFQMSKQVNAGNFCQLYNHKITNRWGSLGHFENPQKPESTKGRDAKGARPEIKLSIWDSGVIICWFEGFGDLDFMVLAARTRLEKFGICVYLMAHKC